MNNNLKKIGSAYIVCMLLLYPVIITDKYYNITDTKLYTFYISTATFAIATIIYNYVRWLKNDENVGLLSKIDLWIIITLVLEAVIAGISTNDFGIALKATVVYGVGIAFFLILGIGVLCVQITGFKEDVFLFSLMLGVTITSALGMLQFLGVDLFGLISSVIIEDKDTFISTIGNTSFFGAYMAVCFPITAYAFNKLDNYRYITSISVALSVIGSIVSDTDATILALAVEMILVVLLMLSKGRDIKKVFQLGSIIAAAILLFNLMLLLSTEERYLFGVQKLFINPIIWGVIFALCLVGGKLVDSNTAIISKVIRVTCKVLLGLIIASPTLSIVYTKLTYVNLDSPISRALYLDYNWGNRRGFIWSKAIELFNTGSPREILLGRGIGSFSDQFQSIYGSESMERYLAFFDDAHNIYLQCMFEYGIIGLILLVIICARVILRLNKSEVEFDGYRLASFIGLLICSTCLVVQNITPAFLVLFM
jgi:hypothetical protein